MSRRRARLRAHAAIALLVAACSAPPARPPETADCESCAEQNTAAAPLGCATVNLGLDLRALGVDPSPSEVNMFVLSQADELVRRTPAGPAPRVRHMPGAGILYVDFGAPSPEQALARCERALASYLPEAPLLPILMDLTVQVIEPCHACTP